MTEASESDITQQTKNQLLTLNSPKDGIPPLISSPAELSKALNELAAGHGPLAADVERAQNYRYWDKAYLLQLRRPGAGSFLIDPTKFIAPGSRYPDFSIFNKKLADVEWVFHNASKDLVNLSEMGIRPTKLFDTELAGRLLGEKHVSLAAMVADAFGVQLLKEYSRVNWSNRPLPEQWLNYAVLDVELLCELRDVLAKRLVETGKADIAAEEFEYLLATAARPVPALPEPWRRVHGLGNVRTRRGLAIARELWRVRDKLAQQNDKYPGKLLSDAAICEFAATLNDPDTPLPTRREYLQINGFKFRNARRYELNWRNAIKKALNLSEFKLPELRPKVDKLPDIKHWPKYNPAGYELWTTVRPVIWQRAEDMQLPHENLVRPESLRQICWQLALAPSEEKLVELMHENELRNWQQSAIKDIFCAALADLETAE